MLHEYLEYTYLSLLLIAQSLLLLFQCILSGAWLLVCLKRGPNEKTKEPVVMIRDTCSVVLEQMSISKAFTLQGTSF